jgi:hypothetical protein
VFALRRGARPLPDGERPLVVRDAAGQWTVDFRAVRAAMGMPDRPPLPLHTISAALTIDRAAGRAHPHRRRGRVAPGRGTPLALPALRD